MPHGWYCHRVMMMMKHGDSRSPPPIIFLDIDGVGIRWGKWSSWPSSFCCRPIIISALCLFGNMSPSHTAYLIIFPFCGGTTNVTICHFQTLYFLFGILLLIKSSNVTTLNIHQIIHVIIIHRSWIEPNMRPIFGSMTIWWNAFDGWYTLLEPTLY